MAFTAIRLVRLVRRTTNTTTALTTATQPPTIGTAAGTTSDVDDASQTSDFGSKPLPW